MEQVLKSVNAFLSEVKATARQLNRNERWRTILSRIFAKILEGRPLATPKPAAGANVKSGPGQLFLYKIGLEKSQSKLLLPFLG